MCAKKRMAKERRALTHHQWRQLLHFFYHHPGVYVGQGSQFRRFIAGVFWFMRAGAL